MCKSILISSSFRSLQDTSLLHYLTATFTRFEQKINKKRAITVNPDLKKIALETSLYLIKHSLFCSYKLMPKKPLDDELIFVVQKNVRNKKAISVTDANKRVAKYFDKYGIVTANSSSHTLRKRLPGVYMTTTAKQMQPLHILSTILNRSDIKTTRKYIVLTDELIKGIYLNL